MEEAAIRAWVLHGLGWLSFGFGHSLFASGPGRRLLHNLFGRGHRLAFNAIALVHVGGVFWLGEETLGRRPGILSSSLAFWGLSTLTLAGLAFGVWSLRYYDGGRLIGIRQLREPTANEDEDLRLDGPHRWMRHPLYTAAFLILWGRAVDPLGLSTALWGSLYLLVGTGFEERKLLALHGESYAAYRRRVPAFVPWPAFVPKKGSDP
ncbi:MAG: isoprenylcysteine carboxylmethyltransferase family protein [Rhodospirillum sp.]|nr:isoprenylcysteine carboxylmethyltransferase family protein [Rhodospirillum sp.]MCF8489868.1 isoprenylcysteine carboxylmethyltransferase family protein [Rhodospirillum sp.]MCF8499431.1 isoprenylcysteine carboxylmethyltransferase family protein [Rhodospirillum sp.]